MNILMGPLLGFRGRREGRWQICVLVVTGGERAPHLTWSVAGGASGESQARALLRHDRGTVWCAELEVPQTESDSTVTYRFEQGGPSWSFTAPGRAARLRFAYTSCNGFSHPRYMKSVDDQNALWKRMARLHEGTPYHLLLMGGDQLYADSIWEVVPSIKEWAELPARKRWRRAFTKRMQEQVERFYFDLYTSRWSQPEPAAMLASVPSVMMWDDHDIFDGWGSYPKKQHESEVYQGIFAVARRYFHAFQVRGEEGRMPTGVLAGGGYNAIHDLGEVALAVLDLRAERSVEQVMGRESWDAVLQGLDALPAGGRIKHLLVMSSIPVVYLDLGAMERALAWTPGQQELEDDLQDHWRARSHQEERLRLIHRLLRFSQQKSCRVTIVSGDVHIAAMGAVESDRAYDPSATTNAGAINQLVSSGIVHPPPSAPVVWFYEQIGDKVEQVDRGITARMLEFAGNPPRRFLGRRNWLSLAVDEVDRIWAEWQVEGEDRPYTKVIHPVG